MAQRMPFGEVARMALMGTAERISARRAYETGLVSRGDGARARRWPAALRARRGHRRRTRRRRCRGRYGRCGRRRRRRWPQALAQAPHLIALGNLPPERQAELFAGAAGAGGASRVR